MIEAGSGIEAPLSAGGSYYIRVFMWEIEKFVVTRLRRYAMKGEKDSRLKVPTCFLAVFSLGESTV